MRSLFPRGAGRAGGKGLVVWGHTLSWPGSLVGRVAPALGVGCAILLSFEGLAEATWDGADRVVGFV